MRKRRGFGSFPLIFLLIFLPILSSDLFEMFFILLALAMPILFVVGIIALAAFISNRGEKTTAYTISKRTRKSSKVNRQNSSKSISAKDLDRINDKLVEYFKDNMLLPIISDSSISLTTQKGVFTTVDDLCVAYKEEKICKMSEFKTSYPDVYEKILMLLSEFAKDKKEEKVKDTSKNKESTKKKETKAVSEAAKYIDMINALNNQIPNEEITNGLYQTCDLLKQIDVVKKENKDAKLNKLYEYYLPILLGILEKYNELEESSIRDDEFYKTESQLVKTIQLINEALKTINSSIHEDDYMNLNADITTLQSLLKKDGLVDDGIRGFGNGK